MILMLGDRLVGVMKRFICLLLLFYATVFQLDHGSDMMYEIKRRKPEPTFDRLKGSFNPPNM